MASEPSYLAVLKAEFDYDPQPDAEDELEIKEDQILLLVERTDEECVRLSSVFDHVLTWFIGFCSVGGKLE